MKYLVVMLLVFAAWAAQMPTAEAESGIEGEITLSPIHGGPSQVGVPDSKALANAEFKVENESGGVAEFITDDAGRFHLSLPPGHYTVSLKNIRILRSPNQVIVTAGQVTTADLVFDNGIRLPVEPNGGPA